MALKALMSGQNARDAAKAAGVSRTTLYRWQRCDVNFIAAHRDWRRQAFGTARSRLTALTDKAITAFETTMCQGDGRVPLSFLRLMGVFDAINPEADNPIEPTREASKDPARPKAAPVQTMHWKEHAREIEKYLAEMETAGSAAACTLPPGATVSRR